LLSLCCCSSSLPPLDLKIWISFSSSLYAYTPSDPKKKTQKTIEDVFVDKERRKLILIGQFLDANDTEHVARLAKYLFRLQ